MVTKAIRPEILVVSDDRRAIVRKNPAFYRARTSPLEARAILVSMPNGYKELWPQQEALYKQFDWAALKKMVNP